MGVNLKMMQSTVDGFGVKIDTMYKGLWGIYIRETGVFIYIKH